MRQSHISSIFRVYNDAFHQSNLDRLTFRAAVLYGLPRFSIGTVQQGDSGGDAGGVGRAVLGNLCQDSDCVFRMGYGQRLKLCLFLTGVALLGVPACLPPVFGVPGFLPAISIPFLF